MDPKQRAELIRKANQFFNEEKYTEAEKLFIATGYKDGLERIGDLLYYEKRQPLAAFKYYKMSGSTAKVNEIFERMIYAFKRLLSEGKGEAPQTPRIHLEPVKVSKKLKIYAEEILRNGGSTPADPVKR